MTVGGGLAGASLARALAERGRRVLVVEREPRFRDRVRGEYLHAWGVAEARRLGLVETLLDGGAGEVAGLTTFGGGVAAVQSDVRTANPDGLGPLCLSHPAMQEAVLAAARAAGAEVLRPATVVGVAPGLAARMAASRAAARCAARGRRLGRRRGRLRRRARRVLRPPAHARGWLTDAFFEVGPAGDAKRGRIFARALAEPGRIPDLVAVGPDAPCDEAARWRFFGED